MSHSLAGLRTKALVEGAKGQAGCSTRSPDDRPPATLPLTLMNFLREGGLTCATRRVF